MADLVYKDELAEWAGRKDVRLVTTVDPGGESPDWQGKVGLVPAVLEELAPSSADGGGPRVRPADHDQVHAACPVAPGLRPGRHLHHAREPHEVRRRPLRPVQRRPKYVCRDGPVFTLQELHQMQTADM